MGNRLRSYRQKLTIDDILQEGFMTPTAGAVRGNAENLIRGLNAADPDGISLGVNMGGTGSKAFTDQELVYYDDASNRLLSTGVSLAELVSMRSASMIPWHTGKLISNGVTDTTTALTSGDMIVVTATFARPSNCIFVGARVTFKFKGGSDVAIKVLLNDDATPPIDFVGLMGNRTMSPGTTDSVTWVAEGPVPESHQEDNQLVVKVVMKGSAVDVPLERAALIVVEYRGRNLTATDTEGGTSGTSVRTVAGNIVSLLVTPNGSVTSQIIRESLPTGTSTPTSYGTGVYDAGTHTLTWTFNDSATHVVGYTVPIAGLPAGQYNINGVATFNGVPVVTTGDYSVIVNESGGSPAPVTGSQVVWLTTPGQATSFAIGKNQSSNYPDNFGPDNGTNISISAHVPDGALTAIMSVDYVSNDNVAVPMVLRVRKDSNAASIMAFGGLVTAKSTPQIQAAGMILVPLTAARTFQANLCYVHPGPQGTGTAGTLTVRVVGYLT